MTGFPEPLRYVGVDELGEEPHVIVDGAPRPGTVLCLSHWPASTTPDDLAGDLSAQIALAYLAAPSHWVSGVEAVTNDHLDEDGAVALLALCAPSLASELAELLVEVARVGDFGVVRSRHAAKVAFALRHLFDPSRSLLARGAGATADSLAWTTRCYTEALAMLGELCAHPDRFATLWSDELARFTRSVAALESGIVHLEEDRALGLAVFRGSASPLAEQVALGHDSHLAIHPGALNSATDCPRVLVVLGETIAYYDRYETWVRYCSADLALRRDLGPLAAELSALEPGAKRWRAEAPGALVPVLEPADARSELDPATVVARLRAHLERAPVAWDPFSRSGPYRVDGARRPEALSGSADPRAGTSGRALFRWRGPRRAER